MKKDILIIAHFCDDFDRDGNNRFNYLANLLSRDKYEVELITSDFSHTKKEKRSKTTAGLNYQVTFISEPGYLGNISFKRLYSHFIMARNLKRYLKTRKKPDIIYCAVPSIDIGKVASEFAITNNIPYILDIQDLWPEAFKLAFNVPVLSDAVFAPMSHAIHKIYKHAGEIIAVSDTYKEKALRYNKKGAKGYSVFLGTDRNAFDHLAEGAVLDKPDDEFRIVYVGTLGHSYNIKVVIDAMYILHNKKYQNIKLIVMGDGPLKESFMEHADKCKINAEFTGRLPYGDMVKKLVSCDVAVNPIQSGAAQSIINKHGDYAMAGLPVISTQETSEYRELLKEYEAGFTCDNQNPQEMADIIETLYHDKQLRLKIGTNSRKLGCEKFDRNQTYRTIIDVIERCLPV